MRHGDRFLYHLIRTHWREHQKNESQKVIGQNKNDPVSQDFTGVKTKRFSGVNAALPSGVKCARLFQSFSRVPGRTRTVIMNF